MYMDLFIEYKKSMKYLSNFFKQNTFSKVYAFNLFIFAFSS